MPNIKLSIDDTIRIKTELYTEMQKQYAIIVDLKEEFTAIGERYREERYTAMKNIEGKKFARKDDLDAALYSYMDKNIVKEYNILKDKIKIVETKIDGLNAQAKQVQDIIVALGIKEKIKTGMER